MRARSSINLNLCLLRNRAFQNHIHSGLVPGPEPSHAIPLQHIHAHTHTSAGPTIRGLRLTWTEKKVCIVLSKIFASLCLGDDQQRWNRLLYLFTGFMHTASQKKKRRNRTGERGKQRKNNVFAKAKTSYNNKDQHLCTRWELSLDALHSFAESECAWNRRRQWMGWPTGTLKSWMAWRYPVGTLNAIFREY